MIEETNIVSHMFSTTFNWMPMPEEKDCNTQIYDSEFLLINKLIHQNSLYKLKFRL